MAENVETYRPDQYERPSVTADVAIFTLRNQDLQVLLVKRAHWPYEGFWALPGGFVQMDESLEESALRELEEETGVADVYLEQLYTFGNPGRDPRTRVITVAYMAVVSADQIDPRAGDDATEACWWSMYELPPQLAFDHAEILTYALQRLRYKLEYTAVGFEILPQQFTLAELQTAYEIILGETLDKANFRKKLAKGKVVERIGRYRQTAGRPAALYRYREDAVAEVKARRLFP